MASLYVTYIRDLYYMAYGVYKYFMVYIYIIYIYILGVSQKRDLWVSLKWDLWVVKLWFKMRIINQNASALLSIVDR